MTLPSTCNLCRSPRWQAEALARPVAWIMTVVLVALMVAAMWVKDRRWSIAILAALILRYVVIYLL